MRRLWCWIADHKWAYLGDVVKPGGFLRYPETIYSLHQCARCGALDLGAP